MFDFLKNHPFAVEAYFEQSLVLTFTFPKEQLMPLLPACLTPDTFNDEWAFAAVAVVKTSGFRPKGFPAFLGNRFILLGYRLFVRYTTSSGKRLRGLYILGSQTDRRGMQLLGNIFTRYAYTRVCISHQIEGDLLRIAAPGAGFAATVNMNTEQLPVLPGMSPFATWKDARRFAGPLPFTFSFLPKTQEVLIVEGVRDEWIPQPVEVLDYQVPFVNDLNRGKPVLASAFLVKNIPYQWKKGWLDPWIG